MSTTTSGLVQGYEVVIGFETHTQLTTQSKLFSRASTSFGAEPNTNASAVDFALPGALPDEVREERQARLMELQEEISERRLQRKVGQTMRVLVDDIGDDGVAVARSSADAPEIDGLVYVEKPGRVAIGDFMDVEITGADAHDLTARKVPTARKAPVRRNKGTSTKS